MTTNRQLVLYYPKYKHEGDDGHRLPQPIIGYGVATIKNSTSYTPGQFLTKAEVTDLCEIAGWDVTVRAPTEKDYPR
jgi:hypothetical protein